MNRLLAHGRGSGARALAVLVCASLLLTCPGPAAYAAAGEILNKAQTPRPAGASEAAAIAGKAKIVVHAVQQSFAPHAHAGAAAAAVSRLGPAPEAKAPEAGAAERPAGVVGLESIASDAGKLAAGLGRMPDGAIRTAADFTEIRRAAAGAPEAAVAAPDAAILHLSALGRASAVSAGHRTTAGGQLLAAGVSKAVSSASTWGAFHLFSGMVLATGPLKLLVVLGTAPMALSLTAVAVAAGFASYGFTSVGFRGALAMWRHLGPSKESPSRTQLSFISRAVRTFTTPIATPQGLSPVIAGLPRHARDVVEAHEASHRAGNGELIAYIDQGLSHPEYVRQEAIAAVRFVGALPGRIASGLRAFGREVREIAFGDGALASILRPHRKLVMLPLVLLLIDGVLNIGMSTFIRPLFEGGGLAASKAKLWEYGSLIVAGFTAYAYNEWKHNTLGQILTVKVTRDFRDALVKNTLLQELGFLQKKENNSGALAKRVRQDVGQLSTKSTTVQLTIPHYMFYMVAGVAGVLVLGASLPLAKPLLIVMPLLGLSGALFLKKERNLSEEQSNLAASLNQRVQEALRYISLVRSSGAADAEGARYAEKSEELVRSEKALVRLDANFGFFNSTLTGLAINLAYLAGGLLIASSGGKALTMGRLVQLTFFAHFLEYAFTGLGIRILSYYKAKGASAVARELILRKPGMTDAADAKPVAGPISVRFDQVAFSYPAEDGAAPVPALDKLSFEAPAGKTVAFVGEKGSGKSTIMDLVLRLRDADSGRVLINGEDIRSLDSKSWRGRIAVVDQRPRLFKGTIRYNVTYGNEDASAEAVDRALASAGADWVKDRERFPEGLDTDVGDFGARLSGGQRQSLVIARAILRNPSLYILDEATEAMDNRSEKDIQAALEHAVAGDGKTRPTTLVIAHRLTTVRNADIINVLDKGRIVESGSHEELLAKGGRYAALWKEGGYDAETSAAGQLAASGAAFALAAFAAKSWLAYASVASLAVPGFLLAASLAVIGVGFGVAGVRVAAAMARHLSEIEAAGPRGPSALARLTSRFTEPIATKAHDSLAVKYLPRRVRDFIALHEAAHRDRDEGEFMATARQVAGIPRLLGQEARALWAMARRFGGKLKIMVFGDRSVRPIFSVLPLSRSSMRNPYFWRLLGSVVLLSGTSYLGVKGVTWLGDFVDLAVLAAKTGFAPHAAGLWSLAEKASAALFLSAGLGRYIQVFVGDLLIDVKWLLKRRIFNALLLRDMKFHMKESAAGLAGRLSDEVDKLAAKNVSVRLPLLQSLLTLAASLYAMVHISFVLSLPVLIMVPVLGYLGGKFAQKTNQFSYEASQASKDVALRAQELFEMAKLIKIFDREKSESQSFAAVAEKFAEVAIRLAKANVNAFVFQSSLGDFFTKYMLYILGIALGVTYGHIVAIVSLAGIAQGAFTTLSAKWTEFQQTHGETAVVLDLLDAKPEVVDAPGAVPLPPGPREIEFQDVSFSYPVDKKAEPAGDGGGKPSSNIVEGVSFAAKAGQRVAIVGSKGSGKSTLLRLVSRLFDPQQGRILVDGRDIRGVTRDSLVREMAVVSQDDQFFDDTIEHNMLYGAPKGVTQEELQAVVRAVAPFFLDARPGTAFPEGLKTSVGEGGARLSGGQRRLIAIVRAALRKPRILLLDEATSALDKGTEQVVLAAIGKIRGPNGEKPTIIEVAHNLPTIMNADRIIALDSHGTIQESGTHRELMARGGLYRQLWDAGLEQRPKN